MNTPRETVCLLARVCPGQPSQIRCHLVIKGQKKSGHKAINEFLKDVGF